MRIKKTIAAGLATVGLTVGLLVGASPAQALTYKAWVHSFESKQVCLAVTATKLAGLSASGVKIKRTTVCTYFNDGYYKPYFSKIDYYK